MPSPSAIAVSKPILISAEPQLFVADISLSINFYTNALRLQVIFSYGEPPFYAQVGRDGAAKRTC
jgi:hypothetical protein